MPPARTWRIRPDLELTLDRPRILAILNVTPDSFSDGGRFASPDDVRAEAEKMVRDGADAIDIGGESTRPGAERISVREQIDRVVPPIRAIRASDLCRNIPITIDTTRAEVARAALDAGADAINDVSAGLEDGSVIDLAAERSCGLILMHRLAPPDADSYSDAYASDPEYDDVVADVRTFLLERGEHASTRGVPRASVVIDPGLGFGKTVDQNLELVRRSAELVETGFPVLAGASKKSFVGRAMNPDSPPPPGDRLSGTLAVSAIQYSQGVRLFRVHDVREHRGMLDTAHALLGAE